jgi:hypothetical protein
VPSPFDVDKGDLMRNVLDHLNIRYRREYRGWQKVRCPSDNHRHGDRNPSASVNVPIGQYHCHACDLKGDGFDLMLRVEGLKAKDALVALGGSVVSKRVESEWLF